MHLVAKCRFLSLVVMRSNNHHVELLHQRRLVAQALSLFHSQGPCVLSSFSHSSSSSWWCSPSSMSSSPWCSPTGSCPWQPCSCLLSLSRVCCFSLSTSTSSSNSLLVYFLFLPPIFFGARKLHYVAFPLCFYKNYSNLTMFCKSCVLEWYLAPYATPVDPPLKA